MRGQQAITDSARHPKRQFLKARETDSLAARMIFLHHLNFSDG